MIALKILTLVGKVAGFVAAMNAIPFVPASWGIWIFAGASILKDGINRIGDLMDDGQANQSFKT